MRVYLGIDGGATKTAAVVMGEDGAELGRGSGGPCNIATLAPAEADAAIRDASREALRAAGLPDSAAFEAACAGVAGYTAKDRRLAFQASLAATVNARRARVEPDFAIAYWGATCGQPGIVLSAGTGAVAYGASVGRVCRIDGRGFLLGDVGSAYWIGARAAGQTVELLHRGHPATPLANAVLAACGCRDADDLVQWVYSDLRSARLAGVARVVGAQAEKGDGEALEVLRDAATKLCDTVCECANGLCMSPGGCETYLLGGLWSIGRIMRDTFCAELDRRAGGSWPIGVARHDAAYGAALLARGG